MVSRLFMHDSDKKGHQAKLKVEERCLEKGYIVCYPSTESRFDLVIVSPEGKCSRVQVKYAGAKSCNSEGSVILNLRRRNKLYTKEEIDAILAFVPAIGKILWIGPDLFHNQQTLTFRYQPAEIGSGGRPRYVDTYIW